MQQAEQTSLEQFAVAIFFAASAASDLEQNISSNIYFLVGGSYADLSIRHDPHVTKGCSKMVENPLDGLAMNYRRPVSCVSIWTAPEFVARA